MPKPLTEASSTNQDPRCGAQSRRTAPGPSHGRSSALGSNPAWRSGPVMMVSRPAAALVSRCPPGPSVPEAADAGKWTTTSCSAGLHSLDDPSVNRLEQLRKRVGVRGFEEVVVAAGLAGPAAVFVPAVAADADDDGLRPGQ